MLQEIIALASLSSHSLDEKGLAKTGEYLMKLFSSLGGKEETFSLPPWKHFNQEGTWESSPLGTLLRFSKREGAPIQLLLVGHYDTVYEKLFPIRQEGDHLFGPGVADMKGGIILMLHLLQWLESSPLQSQVGWSVVLTPDEEIGSPGSRPLLHSFAQEKTLGLVFEPSLPTGAIVGTRPGSQTLVIEVIGKGGHAGRAAKEGKNAITALSEVVLALSSLQDLDRGVIVNPGWIKGGGAANIIPDKAALVVNIRTKGEELDVAPLVQDIALKRGVEIKITHERSRPPRSLLKETETYHQSLGEKVEPSFGVSDANLLEAAGLPTLDGLGPTGFHLHSTQESLLISSLEPRLEKLKALLLSHFS